MKVLSLFDGISCGQLALQSLGVTVDKYYASEIDKPAMKVTCSNFPDTVLLGDVTLWHQWDIPWESIDLLLAGFPCQAWSFAGKGLGLEDSRGMLASTLLDIKEHIAKINPSVKFLFENVVMQRNNEQMLSKWFGVAPHRVNSRLVSAQNRDRLYWYNWDNVDIKDEGVLLSDLGVTDLVCGRVVGRRLCPISGRRKDKDKTIKAIQRFEARVDGKSGCITTVNKDNVLGRGNTKVRDFTQCELERLQTLPSGYTKVLSRNQAQKAIGNSWTVEVIKQILGDIV